MTPSRLATWVVVMTALLAGGPAAHAATGSPPVTVPDRITLRAGDLEVVDVTANDLDPDGQQLDVCRVTAPHRLRAGVADGRLALFPSTKAIGTYQITYYACDDSYLTAGTLTVTVRPPAQSFDIQPVGVSPPGRIRLVNGYKHQTFHCTWSASGKAKPLGRATVKPLSTVVIVIHVAELEVDCESPRSGYSASFGTIDGEG
jgi:hypothetical protein